MAHSPAPVGFVKPVNDADVKEDKTCADGVDNKNNNSHNNKREVDTAVETEGEGTGGGNVVLCAEGMQSHVHFDLCQRFPFVPMFYRRGKCFY